MSTAVVIKKKKKHTALKIVIIILVAIIVLPVAFYFIALFDPTHVDNTPKEGITEQEVFDAVVVDSFDNTTDETNHRLAIDVTQDQLNFLFGKAYQNMPTDVKTYIPSLYIDMQSDKYDFIIECKAAILMTRVHIHTVVGKNETGFYFKINDVVIGRLPSMSIAKSILPNVLPASQIENIFAQAGFHMTLDYSTFTLNYTYENVINDIITMIGPSQDLTLYINLIKEFLEQQLFTLSPYLNKTLSVQVPLENFHTNEEYCTESYVMDLRIPEYQTMVKNMLKDNTITKQNANVVYNFLIRGYDALTTARKAEIDALDISAYVPDVHSYTPLVSIEASESINDIIHAQIDTAISENPSILIDGGTINASVDEVQIHDLLKGTDAIGETYNFSRIINEAGDYKSSYVTFDNMYANIVNGKLYLIITLNVNGYRLSFILKTTQSAQTTYGCTFSFDSSSLLLGNYQCSNDLVEQILELFNTSISSCGEWFTLDTVNKKITLNFEGIFEGTYAALKDRAHLSITTQGGQIIDNGKIAAEITIDPAV